MMSHLAGAVEKVTRSKDRWRGPTTKNRRSNANLLIFEIARIFILGMRDT
jgi:hypothetical protein